jgi:hypothetical protein
MTNQPQPNLEALVEEAKKRFWNNFTVNTLRAVGNETGYVWSPKETKRKVNAELSSFAHSLIEKRDKMIHDDLIAIADQGEYEDLRREVETYFEAPLNPKEVKI